MKNTVRVIWYLQIVTHIKLPFSRAQLVWLIEKRENYSNISSKKSNIWRKSLQLSQYSFDLHFRSSANGLERRFLLSFEATPLPQSGQLLFQHNASQFLWEQHQAERIKVSTMCFIDLDKMIIQVWTRYNIHCLKNWVRFKRGKSDSQIPVTHIVL